MRAHSPTLSTFSPLSALITLLITRQGARRSDRLSIAEAELVIAIALFCCFPDLPFIPAGPSESYFCSHPGRRRVTTAAAVRSFVFGGLMGRCAEWPDSPCGSSGGSGRGGHKHNVVRPDPHCLRPVTASTSPRRGLPGRGGGRGTSSLTSGGRLTTCLPLSLQRV